MRKFGLLFLSVILIAIFFAGFYLYFIPSNKEAQNNYAFLELQNVASNVQSKISANIDIYKNNLKGVFSKNGRDYILNKAMRNLHHLDVSIFEYAKKEDPAQKNISGRTKPRIWGLVTKIDPDTVNCELTDISVDSMTYRIFRDSDSLGLLAPLHAVFDGIMRNHKLDFYQSFLFLKIEDKKALPVYASKGLDFGTDIPVDSLLPGSRNGFYQGIADISLEGEGFKMFYVPVTLGGKHFIMCGFKNAREYQESLHEVSSGFIYPIVIILLLLLIIMPLIKLYIMGADERIKVWDFTGYFSSLFIGSMFITLIIIQVIMLKDGEFRLKSNLRSISGQINNSFQQELIKAYKLLEQVDTIAQGPKDSSVDLSTELIDWISKNKRKDSLYYNFDKISWSDSTGQQIVKAGIDRQPVLFTNVSSRRYYQNFKKNNFNRLAGTDSAYFTLEAVFNWTDGSFRMVIAKKSHRTHAYIVSISMIMYTFSQSILPPGYGYALINNWGRVMVHSDSTHNLNENFLEELTDDKSLKGTIKARQELFVPETKFYGKKNAMLITPVNNLPYFLVTFYDTGSIIPVNMRILIFAILFCFVTFSVCWLLWITIFWRRFSGKPLLFSYMHYLNWITPKSKNIQTYFFGFIFLTVYVVTLSLTILLTDKNSPQDNRTILIILLETPVSVVGGLTAIARCLRNCPDETVKQKKKRTWKSLWTIAALTLMYSSSIWWNWHFLFFELAVLLFLCFIYVNAKKLAVIEISKGQKYLAWHTLLVGSIVICISVLPAALFSRYAHNQEILQAVKKDQLCMAVSIENRQNGIYGELAALRTADLGEKTIDSLRYHEGIYPVLWQAISHDTGRIQTIRTDSGFEKFYFEISDQISNNYYTEGFMPALKDTSWDKVWEWAKPEESTLSFSYKMKPGLNDMLKIDSKIPHRFGFMRNRFRVTALIILECLLLIGLFLLIYQVSEGVFLKKYVDYGNSLRRSVSLPFFMNYYDSRIDKSTDADKISNIDKVNLTMQDAVFDYSPCRNKKLMNQWEQDTISKMQKYKDYYSDVLDRCLPEERYLLYNFALNGFLNYKNVTEIYHLLDEGVLTEQDGEIKMFSLGFRAYLLKYYASDAELIIERSKGKRTAWQSFKTPFYILLVAVAAFIFFTMQETWQRVSALITGLSTAIPLLIGLLRNGKQNSPTDK